MPGQVFTQTLAGATQFDGLSVTTGIFDFEKWSNISRSIRVVLSSVAYAAEAGGASGDVTFYLRSTAPTASTQRILLGRGTQAEMTAPDGRADFSVCGKIVVRDNDGTHWFLEVVTTGKAVNASVVVDVVLQPFPDTSTNDSPDPSLERPPAP